jgi:hypothetical protein
MPACGLRTLGIYSTSSCKQIIDTSEIPIGVIVAVEEKTPRSLARAPSGERRTLVSLFLKTPPRPPPLPPLVRPARQSPCSAGDGLCPTRARGRRCGPAGQQHALMK